LGAVVANEVINIISEDSLLEKSTELGKYIVDSLLSLKGKNSLINDVRGRGLMIAIDFKRDSLYVYKELLKSGFILCKRSNSEVIRLDPSLIVDKSTIDLFLSRLKAIITIN